MLIFTVPPLDGLVVTPGLLPFVRPEYLAANYILFDVGKNIAKESTLANKVRFAFRQYKIFISKIEQYALKEFNLRKAVNETHDEFVVNPGGLALVVVPDDFELKAHVKLADAWLNSSERKIVHKMLNDLGYDVYDILVVRRVIGNHVAMNVDLSPFLKYIKEYGESIVYGIPANESTALKDVDVKCRYHPDICRMHIRLIVDALLSHLQDPWIHLMGPPINGVLRYFYAAEGAVKSAGTTQHTYNAVRSADVTSQRLDIVHYNYVNRGSGKMNDLLMMLRLRHYLTGGLRE